jgi:hypothetical protein
LRIHIIYSEMSKLEDTICLCWRLLSQVTFTGAKGTKIRKMVANHRVCKDCGVSCESQCLARPVRSIDSVIDEAVKPGNREFRGSIIAGKDISSGAEPRLFFPGQVDEGSYIKVETVREAEAVTEDVFTAKVLPGEEEIAVCFSAIPQQRPQMRIIDFYSEEGVALRGIVVAPGTLPLDVFSHKIKLTFGRFSQFAEKKLQETNHVRAGQLEDHFNYRVDKDCATRPAALRANCAMELLSWKDWGKQVREIDAKTRHEFEKRKDEANPSRDHLAAKVKVQSFSTVDMEVAANEAAASGGPQHKRKKKGTLRRAGAEGNQPATKQPTRSLSSVPLRRAPAQAAVAARSRSPRQAKSTPTTTTSPVCAAVFQSGPAQEQAQKINAGVAEASKGEYWRGPKEIDANMIIELQHGANHSRTVNPVRASALESVSSHLVCAYLMPSSPHPVAACYVSQFRSSAMLGNSGDLSHRVLRFVQVLCQATIFTDFADF